LFSYALSPNSSLAQVFHEEDITSLFYLPLSTQAHQELERLKQLMQCNPLTQENDQWAYCWGDKYSPTSFYKHIHDHI
jgi:hypothetical protein